MTVTENLGFDSDNNMWKVVDANDSSVSDIYFENCLTKVKTSPADTSKED